MDPLDIIRRLEADSPNPPTDSELDSAFTELRDALDAATSAETPDLELAKDLRAALDTVKTAQAERETAAEQARAEARALRDGVFDEAEEQETDETDETTDETDETTETAEVKTPVAASGLSVIERLKRHAATKAPADDEPVRMANGARIKSIGPASGYELNNTGFGELGSLFSTHAKSVMGDGRSEKMVRLSRDYPEDRRLGSNLDMNNRRITDVFGFGRTSRPVTAAGGLCGPGDVDHSHPICSERGRPVRDSLVQFNASRGTVTFSPAMSVGDLEDNISIWTAETDADPGDTTKPCPPIECPEELSCTIDAVVKCITVGNFQANFSPEYWSAALEVLAVAHDRVAEQKALEEMYLASTDQGTVDEGNVLNSFLAGVNQLVSSDRSAHRNINGRYTVVADAYIRDYIRNQVIANLGVANNVEALQIADAQIDGWLADIGATAVWTMDGTFDGDNHRLLTPGMVPTTGGVLVYPEDAFLFLDGGTLDLGTQVVDSALNATNDRQAFSESFEKVCFRGCSSYVFDLAIDTACGCPTTGGEG